MAYNDIESRLDRAEAKILEQKGEIADLNQIVTYLFDRLNLGIHTKDFASFVTKRTVH